MERHDLGKSAEVAAAQWFAERFQGRIIARNYRCKAGELDLIFEEQLADGGSELVFIEVRARGNGALQSGVESVGFKKRQRISRTIRHFLQHYRGHATSLRIDILSRDQDQWTHLQNVLLDVPIS